MPPTTTLSILEPHLWGAADILHHSQDIWELGSLESAITRPQATFEGIEQYLDFFTNAAALFLANPAAYLQTIFLRADM